jgi:hypothetical protein
VPTATITTAIPTTLAGCSASPSAAAEPIAVTAGTTSSRAATALAA